VFSDRGRQDRAPAPDTDAPIVSMAPRVPEALVPEVEQVAARAPAPLWLSALVALVAAALIVGVVWLGILGGDRWGTGAMTRTAAAAVEAYIQGDANTLAALSNAQQASRLTPSVRASMAASGLRATFAAPVFSGDTVSAVAAVDSSRGELVAVPDPNGAAVVDFETKGALGTTSGGVALERTWSGWEISGFEVRRSTAPPAANP
jgi:hypothetical protein